MSSLQITEIFYSLQGESTKVGVPTTFIRLTGCPLRCNYCDTPYAFTGGSKIAFAEILSRVKSFSSRYVTITGGEPLAQKNCFSLLSLLCDQNYIVSLETSGAIDVAKVDSRVIKIMDLKTPGSGESERNRYKNIKYLEPQDEVKFVIGDLEDYQWAKEKIIEYALNKRCNVLISPELGRENALSPASLADIMLADRLPARFQMQLHKILWGDVPGK